MKRPIAAFAAVALFSICRGPVAAQDLPPQARIAAIDVAGAERLGKAELVEVSGLHPGDRVTLADLGAAADRIAKSGLVSNVSYRYAYRGTEVTVTFVVVEAPLGSAVLFDNFPWFTDQQLVRSVAEELPGFTGRLPDTSEAIDRVTEALAEQLKSRGLPGQVGYYPFVDMARETRFHLFKVEGVRLPVCGLRFTGVQPSLEGRIRQASQPLVGDDLSRSRAMSFLVAALTPIYRQLG